MSRIFAGASLAGFVPSQDYKAELKQLQDVMEEADMNANTNQVWLRSADAPGFWFQGADNKDYDDDPTTDDGYQWFSARMFVSSRGGFVLLIPWATDKERKDGSSADRALQIHLIGSVPSSFVGEVLRDLTNKAVVLKDARFAGLSKSDLVQV